MTGKRWIGTLLVVLLPLLASSTCWAASISGTLTNNSGKIGRAYIMLKDQYGNSNGFGTSILIEAGTGSTPFILHGIPSGQYQLNGFLDTRANDPLPNGSGSIYSGSPQFGNSTLIAVSSDISNLNYSITNAPAQSVATPAWVNVAPMDSGLFVFFDTPFNVNDIEIADSYNIYWSTSPNPSSTQTAGGGSILAIPSMDDGHQGIPNLLNGSLYYVAVEAVLGGVKSGLATTAVPIPAGNPVGGVTLSGTVTFNGITPVKPLIVIAYSNGGMYLTRIANPAASQPYSIQGVQPGSYSIGAVLDQNDNMRIDAGDLVSGFDDASPVSVAGSMALPDITLINQAVFSRLTTGHNNYGQDSYFLSFYFQDQAKQPTHVEIISGPNMGATSIGMNNWGEFELNYQVPKPIVGDSYSATVYFSDGSSSLINGLTVTGRVDALPVVTYPMGQTGTDGTSPRFAWYLSGLPAGDYRQNLQLYSQGNGDDWQVSVPITQNSYKYDGPTLSTGGYYNGQIEISDQFGNVSQSYFSFQPTVTALTVSSVTPGALACGSSSPITIDGTGFDSAMPGDNLVFFNSNSAPAQVTSATATRLTVTLPNCTTGIVRTGPVIVATNSVSAVQQGDFTPQVSFTYLVNDGSNVNLAGATIEVDGTPAISTTSNSSGVYILSGIPAGIPLQQKLSKAGYLPTYSARMLLGADFAQTGNYNLFTALEVAAWDVTPGKGVIRSRVVDNTGAYLGGAVVTAYSTLYNSSSYYPVTYTSGTVTQADGRYYVLNVEEGDTVVVTAVKVGYTFNKRTFVTHADAVCQGSVTGTPVVSVSGMNPSTAPTGSSIVINGSNFSTTPSQNSVCFSYSMGGQFCTVPTAATATQLTVSVPCGVGTGLVTVTSNGQTVNAGTFTVPVPTISGFTPTSGPSGMPVTITGTGFSSGACYYETNVNFAGQLQYPLSSTATELVFNTFSYSQGATTGTISVTTPGGTGFSSASLTVYPLPNTYGMITPNMAAPGESVAVDGTYYDFNTNNYQMTVGGIPATITSVSDSALVFTVPPNAGSGGSVEGTYYSYSLYGSWLTVIYHLSVTITGEGTINSTNGLGGLSCPTATGCSANFYYNEPASLAASPSAGYAFGGWSGDCGGTGNCVMNMTANKSVTATFTLQPNIKIGTTPYGTIQSAFNAAANGDELKLRALTFVETPFFNSTGVAIKMKGGYDSGFSTQAGTTTVSGSLKIRAGTFRLEKIAIKP